MKIKKILLLIIFIINIFYSIKSINLLNFNLNISNDFLVKTTVKSLILSIVCHQLCHGLPLLFQAKDNGFNNNINIYNNILNEDYKPIMSIQDKLIKLCKFTKKASLLISILSIIKLIDNYQLNNY